MPTTDIDKPSERTGFTIVELLIVIVVIAIIAAITVVAYNGIQDRGRMNRAYAFTKQVQRTFIQDKFVEYTFEDGIGNGNTSPPTDTSGYNTNGNTASTLKTIASTELPNSNYVYDFSQSGGVQSLARRYPSTSAQRFPSGSFVLTYWFKQASGSNSDGHLLICFDCGTGQQTEIQTGSINTGFGITYKPRYDLPMVTLRSKPYDLSKWHNVVVRFDNTTKLLSLYIDGSKEAEQTSDPVQYSTNWYFDIGRGFGGNFFGQIDDFKIASYID